MAGGKWMFVALAIIAGCATARPYVGAAACNNPEPAVDIDPKLFARRRLSSEQTPTDLASSCYSKTRKQAGEVELRFVIAPDGSIGNVCVEHTTAEDDDVERCLVDAVSAAIFPPTRDGAPVAVRQMIVVRGRRSPPPIIAPTQRRTPRVF